MAYFLQAILGTKEHLEGICPKQMRTVALPLEPRLAMIPLVDKVMDAAGWPPSNEKTPEGGVLVRPRLEAILVRASASGMIGYAQAEYFGGVGEQFAFGWLNEKLVYPTTDQSRVNGLLALLGVKRSEQCDEWDTVGLGRHRHAEDWLK